MEVFQQLDRLSAPPEEKHRFISVERAQTDERVDRGGPRYSVSVRRVLASRYRSHEGVLSPALSRFGFAKQTQQSLRIPKIAAVELIDW